MDTKYLRLMVSIIVAAVIIIVVLVIGYSYDTYKISYLSSLIQTDQQSINQLQLAMLLTSMNNSFSCNILTNNLYQISNNIQQLSQELTSANLPTSEANYSQINNQYTYLRVEYWLLANKINDICGDKFVTVMFIYGVNCDSCIVEGDELSYLSSRNDSLIVSALNGDLNNPLVLLLLKSYNLTNSSFPSIIIANKYLVNGFQNTTALENDICKYSKCLNFHNQT